MSEILFFSLSFFVLYGAIRTITHRNLVVCSLHLAGSMLSLAGLFFILGAQFIAAVQVLVYAGAVMVLFIMVLMLFNLKEEKTLFSEIIALKGSLVFVLTSLIIGIFPLSVHLFTVTSFTELKVASTKSLAQLLFSDYILAFEILGVLLLLIAVGVASLCRSKKE